MTLTLAQILPNLAHTLDGTGFFFGAGASHEAGYPMMPTLTRDAVSALDTASKTTLDEVLVSAGTPYDDATANPNIEQIADLVIAHWTNSGDPRFSALEKRLREVVIDRILSVTTPNLDNHCRFLDALKRRAFGLSCSIWIFTTNYDLLFERAAAQVGVAIENGFCGSTERFFNPALFRSTPGTLSAGRFTPSNVLTVRLVKLHGSISWIEESLKFYEVHPAAIDAISQRAMVLPRRRKVMETLTPPYDTLFAQASRAIGGPCKYIASCGFGYGDDHINQNLLLPALQTNKCRLFALCKEEPSGISQFRTLPNFGAAFEGHRVALGINTAEPNDVWQFSKFVSLFE